LKIKANLILPSTLELKEMTGLNEGGRGQKYIDSFVLNHCEPYVPGKHIHEQGVIATKIGSGQVIWNSPDANYLYEGKLMVDPITLKGAFFSPNYGFWSRPNTQKIMDPNGRNLEYHGGGLRGSKWFDRMINSEMDELVEGLQNIVNGGK
jgi:hypothetical protein